VCASVTAVPLPYLRVVLHLVIDAREDGGVFSFFFSMKAQNLVCQFCVIYILFVPLEPCK
jgi:hypothetical protein